MTLLYSAYPSKTKNQQNTDTNDYTKSQLVINLVTYKKYVYELITYAYQKSILYVFFWRTIVKLL